MKLPAVQLFHYLVVVSALNLVCGEISVGQDLFPDKNLESVVRREVFEKRNSKDPLVAKDVENISQIKGLGKKIKSLKGLEACVSLRSIWLDDNEISDLAPLKDLKLLQQLMLKNNQIVDVSPLKNLTKLQHLDVSQNQIESIKDLDQFKNMRSFYAGNNKITDIGVVVNYPKAWSLYIQNNPVSNLKPIEKLRFLDHLDISRTQVADLSPLSNLTNLKRVMMEESKVTDLAVLVAMAEKDAKGPNRFAPFWNLHLKGCALSEKAKSQQIPALKKLGSRVHLD